MSTFQYAFQVFKADYKAKENEDENTDRNVSDKRNGQEEDFDKPSHMSENLDDGLQDNDCTQETNGVESVCSEEPATCILNVPASLTRDGKDEASNDENYLPDNIDHSYRSSSCQLCEDKVMAPVPVREQSDEGCFNSEVTEELLDKHPLNEYTVFTYTTSPKFDKQEAEIKQKDGLSCSQEDVVLPIMIDGVKEKRVTSDNIAVCGEQCDSSSLGPSLSSVVLVEESIDPPAHQCYLDQQIGQLMNNENFDHAGATTAPDTSACDDDNIVAPIIDEVICPNILMNNEIFDKATVTALKRDGFDSAADAAACGNATITAPLMSEAVSRPETQTSFQDQQSEQVQHNIDFSKVTSHVAPVLTNDINPATCKMNLLSFEQCELKDNDKDNTYPGVEVESGISSMAVSPDLQDAANEFDMLITDDVASSVINKDTTDMAFGSHQSGLSQKSLSEPADWAKHESFAANEDVFGHEIDDCYHRALDEFMAEIAANVPSFTCELKEKTEIKRVVKGVDIKECSGVSETSEKKVEMEAEKDEDYEKTEISIMEATMDNNEWITDSNYQVLPWMNASVSSFAQDNTKTNQLPTTEHQHSSSLTEDSEDTDTTPSTEVKPTNTLPLVDENTENSKKVVAVQPMPQNVNVTFRIHYLTHSPYQTVAVTGNQQELGNWKGFIPLERAKDGHWSTVVILPTESHVEWKFVLVDKGEVCRWEECGNRFLDTGFGDDLIVHKWWGLL